MAKMKVAKVQNVCYDLLAEYSAKSKIDEYGGPMSGSSIINPSQLPLSYGGGSACMHNFDLYVSFESEIRSVRIELDHYMEQ